MGKEAVANHLEANPEDKATLEKLVIEAISPKKKVEEQPETELLEA